MQAAPGWTATLDGETLPTFAIGPDMVGVLVPKGAHRLIFNWKMPLLGWVSLIMTLSALLMVFAIWSLSGWRGFGKWVRRK